MCLFINDVPHAYHGPIDDLGRRTDASTRPELSQGSVEFVAPVEYMVRPPQPPVYMFVIDVSYPAVTSGVVHTVCAAIKQALPTLPGGERTQVGFVTYNSSVHFYNLRATLSAPAMLVVPDISDVFLPVPDDLLVNLSESRGLVDQLLDSLPKVWSPIARFCSGFGPLSRLLHAQMHTDAKNVETCLGTALDAAFNIMQHIGGKMVVCQTSLPSLGKGKLKHRCVCVCTMRSDGSRGETVMSMTSERTRKRWARTRNTRCSLRIQAMTRSITSTKPLIFRASRCVGAPRSQNCCFCPC
jgi:protein transport protein SEC24